MKDFLLYRRITYSHRPTGVCFVKKQNIFVHFTATEWSNEVALKLKAQVYFYVSRRCKTFAKNKGMRT